MLFKHKKECEQKQELTTTSVESHLYSKKQFHMIPLFIETFAVFEADNEIDNSSIVKKSTKIKIINKTH